MKLDFFDNYLAVFSYMQKAGKALPDKMQGTLIKSWRFVELFGVFLMLNIL